ncbi:MAG: hypothetical protein JEZ07_01465 [Phycisphaerae bacterium]|nr:hypothetical protein [Phycisphaerae bacterium]
MAKKTRKKTKKKIKQPGFLARSYVAIIDKENASLRRLLMCFVVFTALAVVAVWGFGRMESYVKAVHQQRNVVVHPKFLDLPEWIDPEKYTRDRGVDKKRCEDILNSISNFVDVKSENQDFILDEDLAQLYLQKLGENPWIKSVRQVQKTYDGIINVDCEFRHPIAKITDTSRGCECYLDADGIVLPATNPLPTSCHVVEIKDYRTRLPLPGGQVESRDILSALEILASISKYQKSQPANCNLWRELAKLSLKNFDGRNDRKSPHIMLYTSREVPIRWGTRIGNETAMVEPPAEHKLEMLFREYNIGGNGSFNILKVVELCLYDR